MSKPVNVVVDYRTHRSEMRETISQAVPHRHSLIGVAIGFACTIAIAWAAYSLMMHVNGV